ncbi:pyruvate kinase [Corynebacterium sp. TAE3-ERU12]|uniref:pyruvate kinase n=1 Tax=Corynebacterium sp. TAE3-ERU12 TaxID=2849491 RepID=UPI00351D0BAF
MTEVTNTSPLIDELDHLLAELDRVTANHADDIAQVTPEQRAGAENLLHYAYLRTVDIRGLQNRLHDLGVTSLTTAESLARGRLQLARGVLRALAGLDPDTDFSGLIAADDEADRVLDNHADRLFGTERAGVPARIMVTLPAEAADDAELVRSFAEAGMDLARINCAHDGPEAWLRMIDNVHAAASATGRNIAVSMDLAGPKLRTGAIADGPKVGRARVTRDDAGTVLTPSKLWLTAKSVDLGGPERHCEPAPPPAGLPGRPALPLQVDSGWLGRLTVGSEISLHDNRDMKRHFTVTEINADGVLACGDRNAYINEGCLLRCDYEKTRATGIKPTVRKLRLNVGDELILTDEDIIAELPADGEAARISCSLPEAVHALTVGDPVIFDDGAISAEVIDTAEVEGGFTDVRLRVQHAKPGGQKLAAHKGINLPETVLPLPSLTVEDIEHLRFVAEHADIAAVSFIRTPQDVERVLEVLDQIVADHEQAGAADAAERARNLGIVLKIETIPGFRNLPEVMLTAMRRENTGIMIARGDLAVELGFRRMGEVPGQILALAQAARMPVVLGTQVLESLAKSGLPSRAEITDAALALRAECVMLNKGPHITDAIGALNDLATAMGRSQRKSRIMLRKIRSWEGDQ